jgi:carbon-monoxide dehydrogenase large subunit
VRVTNPDVGGGFGMKAMRYPEYFCSWRSPRATRPAGALDVGPDRGDAVDNAGRDLVT